MTKEPLQRTEEQTLASPLPHSYTSIPPLFVLHWNRPEECLRTIEAFRAQQANVALYVVDNHSEQTALQAVQEGLASDVRLIRLLKTKAGAALQRGRNAGWLAAGEVSSASSAHDALPANLSRLFARQQIRIHNWNCMPGVWRLGIAPFF